MTKDVVVFIEHILESIEKIESFSKDLTKEKLSKSDLYQSAIVRQIEIIGEAVKNIPISFKEKHSGIPWREIAGMRDKVIHQYFNVDVETIWKTLQKDIPYLKFEMIKIRNALKQDL